MLSFVDLAEPAREDRRRARRQDALEEEKKTSCDLGKSQLRVKGGQKKGARPEQWCSAGAMRRRLASEVGRPSKHWLIDNPEGLLLVIKLIRTDTTLDLSQKAEKACYPYIGCCIYR